MSTSLPTTASSGPDDSTSDVAIHIHFVNSTEVMLAHGVPHLIELHRRFEQELVALVQQTNQSARFVSSFPSLRCWLLPTHVVCVCACAVSNSRRLYHPRIYMQESVSNDITLVATAAAANLQQEGHASPRVNVATVVAVFLSKLLKATAGFVDTHIGVCLGPLQALPFNPNTGVQLFGQAILTAVQLTGFGEPGHVVVCDRFFAALQPDLGSLPASGTLVADAVPTSHELRGFGLTACVALRLQRVADAD